MRYSKSLFGRASRVLSVSRRSITSPMSYGASAATSASGATGGSTRTPGSDRPSPPSEPDGHLDLGRSTRRLDDVVEQPSWADGRLIDRPHGSAGPRLDVDLLERRAVEDEERRSPEPQPARQLGRDRLADRHDRVGAPREYPFETQREPVPEPRRILFEAAVQLVRVVDEPRPPRRASR